MLRFVLTAGGDGLLLRLELGRASRELGRLEEALSHYGAAIAFAPQDRGLRWYRASILMALGRKGEALEDIEAAGLGREIRSIPLNGELVDHLMIRSFLENGDWRRAGEACRNRLRNPGGAPAIFHAFYAEALRNMGDYRTAHNHLLRAQEEEPGELQFRYADLLCCWEGRDSEDMWRALRRTLRGLEALPGVDRNLTGRFAALLEAHNAGDGKKRLALLQGAVRKLGPEPELMYALGEAYLALGFLEEARGWFAKTRTMKPDHEAAALGEIASLEALLKQGGISEKKKAAGKTAGGTRREDREGELKALYGDYLTRWPGNLQLRRDRALFLLRIRDYEEALGELEKLLAREPGNRSLRRVLAYGFRKTGRYREAAVFLKALLRECPGDLRLLLEFSGCLERIGAQDYALLILQKAREHIRDSGEISLALGILWYRKRNLEKAFDCLREAAAQAPRDSRPWDWMAAISRKNGETEQEMHYAEESRRRKSAG